MATQIKKLMTKHAAQNNQHAFGSYRPQFGAKVAASDVPHAKRGEGLPITARDGGNHPETHNDDLAKREMIAVYNRYVSVYDKVSTTRKRKSYHRKSATTMQGVNERFTGRMRGGSLVERVLRGKE